MKKVMLLGAGFSYELGMPLAFELTEIFLGIFTESNAQRLVNILSKNEPFGDDRPISESALNEAMQLLLDYKKANGKNYEELLSNIQSLSNNHQKSQSDKDSYHYFFSVLYTTIHEILNHYQIVSYSRVYPNTFASFKGLSTFSPDKATWVFTLNHDMFLECLALDFGIPITYGDLSQISFPISNKEMGDIIDFTYSNRDDLTSNTNSFFKDQYGINLVKLHGGLSELEYNDGKKLCNQTLLLSSSIQLMTNFMKIKEMCFYEGAHKIPSGQDRFVTNINGDLDIVVQSMLTGGSKYSLTTNAKKGEEKLGLFVENLKDADELTIIGYGFGDKHINYRISNAMVLNENLKLTIIDPISKPIPELLEQFNYNLRIKQVICGAPHWLGYLEEEKWNSDLTDFLNQYTEMRNVVFDTVKRKFCG